MLNNIYTQTDGTAPKGYSYSINPFAFVRPDTKEIIITHSFIPPIEKVIFNKPATIVFWEDGDKTVVKCQDGDTYSKETGLAMCIAKKALGNKGNFNDVFKEWIPGYGERKEKEIEVRVNGCHNCKYRGDKLFQKVSFDGKEKEYGYECSLIKKVINKATYICDKWGARDGESD